MSKKKEEEKRGGVELLFGNCTVFPVQVILTGGTLRKVYALPVSAVSPVPKSGKTVHLPQSNLTPPAKKT